MRDDSSSWLSKCPLNQDVLLHGLSTMCINMTYQATDTEYIVLGMLIIYLQNN